MMDLKKFKGINWVGNIYQKFEEICLEVDDIVNQDKFNVQAQVQTVSKSVKKIYSDVQDLLPPLRDPVKHDPQDVAIKENSSITKSKENLEEASLDLTEKQSPTEPSANPGTNQLNLVSSKDGLEDQDQLAFPTSMGTLEFSESDFSLGKIEEASQYEIVIGATSRVTNQPNIMDVVTNQPSLVSSQYHIADQPSSPTSVDGFQVSEFELSVGKVDEVLKNETFLDATEEPNIVDHGINQLDLMSRKYHLPDQTNSPTSRDTLDDSEWGLFLEEIDEVLANEDSLDATAKKSPLEPIVMDPVANQLCLVSSKYHLEDQPSSPTSMDSFEVPESELSAGTNDEVLTNEIFLDATEAQSPTDPNVTDAVENKLSLFFSKYHLADRLSSPYSMDNLEVLESDLSVAKMDDILTKENLDANDEQISKQLSEPILFQLTNPVVSEHFAVPPFGVFSHSDHENRHVVLPEVAPFSSRNSVEVAGCFSDGSFGLPSSASPLSVSDKNKDLEKELYSFSSVLSLNSVAEGTSRITEIIPLTVPSSKEQVEVYETVQYDALKSSDIGCPDESSSDSSHSHMETIDLHDKVKLEENSSHSRMETIDFHDKVKLEESCVIVDDNMLHAISSRSRKLRSYKQRIQDAFTSKKRLAKQYEQLAIWFGDTDIDSSQEIPSNAKTVQTPNACDSEWELL